VSPGSALAEVRLRVLSIHDADLSFLFTACAAFSLPSTTATAPSESPSLRSRSSSSMVSSAAPLFLFHLSYANLLPPQSPRPTTSRPTRPLRERSGSAAPRSPRVTTSRTTSPARPSSTDGSTLVISDSGTRTAPSPSSTARRTSSSSPVESTSLSSASSEFLLVPSRRHFADNLLCRSVYKSCAYVSNICVHADSSANRPMAVSRRLGHPSPSTPVLTSSSLPHRSSSPTRSTSSSSCRRRTSSRARRRTSPPSARARPSAMPCSRSSTLLERRLASSLSR
jgi:hypothetical protein